MIKAPKISATDYYVKLTDLKIHVKEIFALESRKIVFLCSRWKVRFRQTFFYGEVQRVLHKLVLVTYPLDHSQRIFSPSNFRFI